MYETATRALITLLMLLFASLAGLAGLGFMVAAIYLALASLLLPVWAAALTGFILLVLALLMLLAIRFWLGGRQQAGASSAPPGNWTVTGLRRVIEEHTLLASGGAFSAGFYLGVNPEARRALLEVLLELQTGQQKAAAEKEPPTP